MSLNTTPAAERIHIGIFGKRNAGKSSLINAITSQNLAIVSEQKGTTTDPVYKAMELLPLGPVMVIDTPGIDDEGELGKLRIEKAYQVLNRHPFQPRKPCELLYEPYQVTTRDIPLRPNKCRVFVQNGLIKLPLDLQSGNALDTLIILIYNM